MAKQPFDDYAEELRHQIAAWKRKPGLRAVYHHWYQRVVDELSSAGPTVEIGSGCGNFKRFKPDIIATDVFACGDWIDDLVDARQLPFAEDSIGNIVLFDCLHHLLRPLQFLRHASRALKTGGRIVLFEPAATPWARLVWKCFHHEPVDFRPDFHAEDETPEPENPGFTYANMATAHALFVRGWPASAARLNGLQLRTLEFSDFLVYPSTGGFSYYSAIPSLATGSLHKLERALLPRFAAKWLGLRLLIVLEKRS